MRQFLVWHEKGGYIHVFADDEQDAVEQFYESIESIVGHHLKICGCFGEKKKLDRSKIIKPTRIEEVIGDGKARMVQ